MTFLLAEQNTKRGAAIRDYGYILESGRVVTDGPAADLRENPECEGILSRESEEGRKSFRDVRSYPAAGNGG